MKKLAILLPSDNIYKQGGKGAIRLPLDGTVVRLKRTMQELNLPNSEVLIICTAGYGRASATQPNSNNISFAEQVARFVNERRSSWNKRLIALPLTWSTGNELRTGIELAQENGFTADETIEVVVVSTWFHLPGIYLWWICLKKPKRWKIRLFASREKSPLHAYIWELPALIRDIARILKNSI